MKAKSKAPAAHHASLAEMEQVVALAASTIGFPASVAVWSWVREEAGPAARPKRPRRR
jgi:hypothetical protein